MTYTWEVDGSIIGASADISYTFNDDGIFPVTLSVVSDFGCFSDSVFNVYIYPTPDAPILSVTSAICPDDPVTFTALAEDNSTINWSGPMNFESTDFVFDLPISLDEMGYYNAFITSQYGCISDTSNVLATIINIFDFDDFVFPNVLTANSDGTNDELNLFEYFKTCEEYTLYIFNRWGNKVFEQTLYSPQFKGETISGDILEEGVYFYKLIVRDAEEDKSVKHGYIHIVK